MTFFGQAGRFKIWARDLPTGEREFQVRDGNRVISRHRWLLEAQQEASGLLDLIWDKIAQS